jgi:hypothetical protein
MANANVENESGVTGAAAALTLADVVEEFGPDWQLREGYFCWTATRRPTPTAREIVTGQTLDQLAVKLRAEMDGQG